MTDPLLRYRQEFPILEKTTYLISNSLGAMPRGVFDALYDYAGVWAERGVRAWEEYWWDAAAGDWQPNSVSLMNAPMNSVGHARQCHPVPGAVVASLL